MKKILISPDFLYQISLYLLLPNLATTKFLILKQAKKLVMRMNTRKLAPGKRNIAGARDRSTFHRNARYLTSSSRRWPKFWISMSAGCSARFEISKEKITCYSSEPAETISGSLFLSEGNLRWKMFMFRKNRAAITGMVIISALVYIEWLRLFSRRTAEVSAYRPEKAAFRACHVLSRWTAGVCVSWYGVKAGGSLWCPQRRKQSLNRTLID